MGTYELLLCSKRNAVSVVVTCEVVGTLNHYNMVKKLIKRQWRCKNFSIISSSMTLALSLMLSLVLPLSLVLVLSLALSGTSARDMSHLLKLSPHIFNFASNATSSCRFIRKKNAFQQDVYCRHQCPFWGGGVCLGVSAQMGVECLPRRVSARRGVCLGGCTPLLYTGIHTHTHTL